MSKNAFKVPILNREGVIPSEELTIEIPATITADFLTIIKNNPNAKYLYGGKTFETSFTSTTTTELISYSTEKWSSSKELTTGSTLAVGAQITFVFDVPTNEVSDYRIWLSPNTDIITKTLEDNKLTVSYKASANTTYNCRVEKLTTAYVTEILTITNTLLGGIKTSSRKFWQTQNSDGTTVVIDGTLSKTSTNPVQNLAVANALDKKADVNTGYQFYKDEILISNNDGDCLVTGSGKALGDFASADHTHDYNDLTDKPTIPTKTSDLTNDSGFITADDVGNLNSIALSYASTMEILTSTIMPIGTTVENNNATFPEGITVNNHNINL